MNIMNIVVIQEEKKEEANSSDTQEIMAVYHHVYEWNVINSY